MNALILPALQWLGGKFFGTNGQPASNAAVNTMTIIGLAGPAAIWLLKYDAAAAITFNLPPWFTVQLSWGQFAFVILLNTLIFKFAHWVKSPTQ